MKLEFEIEDVTKTDVADAMARHLLTRWSHEDGGSDTGLAELLRREFSDRITKLADEAVRSTFDEVIRQRIEAAVDVVLTEGWYETDGYGGRKSDRQDLRARIGKALTEQRGDGYNRRPSLIQERLDEAIKGFLDKEFNAVVNQAKATLKHQLDNTVMSKVADTIKSALGLK